jgi:hypothetical protein
MSEPSIGVAIIEHRHGTSVYTSLLRSTVDRRGLNELIAEDHCREYWCELAGKAGDIPDKPEDIVEMYFQHHPDAETCTVQVENLDNIMGGVVLGFTWDVILADLGIDKDETQRILHLANTLGRLRGALVDAAHTAILDFMRKLDTHDSAPTDPA